MFYQTAKLYQGSITIYLWINTFIAELSFLWWNRE